MPRDRFHKCGWPGCEQKIEAWRWGCYPHFARLPDEHKHNLGRLKHWWPEGKKARRAATAWAKRQIATKEK